MHTSWMASIRLSVLGVCLLGLPAWGDVSTEDAADSVVRGPIEGGATTVEQFLESFPAGWGCEQFDTTERYIVNISCDARRAAYFYYNDAAAMEANRDILQKSSDENWDCVVHSGKTFALASRWREDSRAPSWDVATQEIIDSFSGVTQGFGLRCPDS